MSDDRPFNTADGAAPDQPQVKLISQYIKDLSFENPNAPDMLVQFEQHQSRPDLHMDIGLNARKLGDTRYEVELKMTTHHKLDDKVVFVMELAYAGLFDVQHVPENQMQLLLMVYAPQLLFPFARRILADLTRDGGYKPLLLDPIDFAALFQAQMQKQRAEMQNDLVLSGNLGEGSKTIN